jgi:hypothetical protein
MTTAVGKRPLTTPPVCRFDREGRNGQAASKKTMVAAPPSSQPRGKRAGVKSSDVTYAQERSG